MTRIIDMLLKMVYPMLAFLFIACFADVNATTLYRGQNNSYYMIKPLYGFAIIFGIMFLIGIILNIVNEILHLEDKKPETQKQKTILFIIKIAVCAIVWASAFGHCLWFGIGDFDKGIKLVIIVFAALLVSTTCVGSALIVAYIKDRKK